MKNSSEDLWFKTENLDLTGIGAAEVLNDGFPAYYRLPDTPPGLQVKEYPNGQKELIRFSRQGDVVIERL